MDFHTKLQKKLKTDRANILECLGEPSTDLQKQALSAYQAGDSAQLTRLMSLNLGDFYLRCLRYLDIAGEGLKPGATPDAIDRTIDDLFRALEIIKYCNKETSYRKPDSLTESCDRIFRTMLEN